MLHNTPVGLFVHARSQAEIILVMLPSCRRVLLSFRLALESSRRGLSGAEIQAVSRLYPEKIAKGTTESLISDSEPGTFWLDSPEAKLSLRMPRQRM